MRILLLLVTLHFYAMAGAQVLCSNSFTGQILDGANQPVIGAAIFLAQSNIGTATDTLGNFRFNNLCAGKYVVKIQSLGYKYAQFEIQIVGHIVRIIHIKETLKELNEVVVEEHLLHTEHANNFAVLNEKQLAESAGKTLGESLKEIPGVNTIQTGPGIFKPVIHGVHSQRILILNDGIRHEGQQWGAEHAPEIDPFIASNIVVIKDASAIKYGTDALGGVIVINPPALPEKAGLGGTLNTVFQSNGRSGTLSGMLEGGIKKHDGWGWRVQGTAKRSGDYNTPTYVLTNTGAKELNFSSALGYHKNNAGFDVFFSHFQTQLGILKGTSIGSSNDLDSAMRRDIPQYTQAFSYKISAPRQEVSHNLFKINGHIKSNVGDLRLQYAFQNNNREEFNLRIDEVLTKKPSLNLKLNTHTLKAEWESIPSENRSLCFGFSGMYQNNKNIYGTQNIPFIPGFNSFSGGIFGIGKFYFKRWTVDLGTRYDYRYYNVSGHDYKNTLYKRAIHFNNASVTAGATLKINNNQTLNMNLSSAWRPPSVAELYSAGTHQSAVAIEYGLLLDPVTTEVRDIKTVNFKIEQALKCVVTYQRQWKTFHAEVSPYINYIFNYIYLRPEGITKGSSGTRPYFRYTQTDALFMGVDLSGVLQVNKSIKLVPKASLLRASDYKNHDYLIYIPSNRYEVAIRYERPSLFRFKNLYVESKTKYVARQNRAPQRIITVSEINDAKEKQINLFENDQTNFDFKAAPNGYWLWNLSTGVSIKNKKVQYDFRIASENTLNTRYREYTNRFRYYADDIGSNIIISMKCIF